MLFRSPKLIKVEVTKTRRIRMGTSPENSGPYHVAPLSFEHVGV